MCIRLDAFTIKLCKFIHPCTYHSLYPPLPPHTHSQIDILVNNAGRSQRAEAKETRLDVDRAVLELNTLGTISMTKVVLPHMLEQEDGGIITVISSVAGKMGEELRLIVKNTYYCS